MNRPRRGTRSPREHSRWREPDAHSVLTCFEHRSVTLIGMRFRGGRLAPVALALMLLTAATGCRAGRNAGSAPSGTSTHTIKVDGQNRSFRVYRPAALDPNNPAPLVVMLHGGFGTAKQAESSYGWDQKADAEHFLVAYPDG